MASADLAVVGGGPAGLAAATFAAARGLRAVVFERAAAQLDKACGEGILPAGARCLAEQGVRFNGETSAPFRGVRFLDDGLVAQADFPGGPGLAVRRPQLLAALLERAAAAGVELRLGVEVRGLADGGIVTAHGTERARFVVGADGLHSRVRRWAGLDAGAGPRRRFGVRRHYAVRPWSEYVEVHWGERCEAYVTPVGSGCVGIAILWSGGKASFDELLRRFPALAARLAGRSVASRDRGAGPLHQRARGAVRGRVALVGDAGGYLDALTGEGIALALREAGALAEAAAAGDLRRYAREKRRLARIPELLTRFLLSAERRPGVRRRLIRALARDPSLFGRLLGLHGGALAVRRVGLVGALRLMSCWLPETR